ncbi:MAG: glycosyltransferase family 4 protein [Elusimicrobia bacterium]|jgi:glycosyltransferase involved in cell wall biosynthesis|nr:glycosyltransferase family 4 protein [Elusimicrobiota bacterium]
MKILHILDERWDSGVTAYGLSAARAMRDRGHEVYVAAREGLAPAIQAEKMGFPVHRLASLLSLRRWAGAIGFDVVNAHTGTGHSVGFFITRFRPTALIRTRGEARTLSIRPGQGFLFRETDGVIVASKALAESYGTRFPFLMEQISLIYPGIDLPALPPVPPGPVHVGLLGRLDPVKGHSFFLEAVGLMKDHLTDPLFLIAGEEKNTARVDLEKQATRLGIERWVRFLGRVPDAGAFMNECHVGVISSVESEAVSRAALEWLARGRPLIATEVGALPEMVLNGDNGFLVPPKNATGLARTIRILLEDPARRTKMGERARRIAETRFSLARMGQETEKATLAAVLRRKKRFS